MYFWLVQEMELSQREESDFFLEIEFYMNKFLIHYGLSSHKHFWWSVMGGWTVINYIIVLVKI